MPRYRKISNNIHELKITKSTQKTLTWINIVNAGKDEIEYLRKNYKFNLAHLQASSSKVVSQRPITEKNKDYFFMILHFPILQNEKILTGEIEFFIGKDYIVTLNNNIKALYDFFNFYKKEGKEFSSYTSLNPTALLYEILEKLMLNCYSFIDTNSIIINEIEESIFTQRPKNAVSNILFLRRNIINTRKIMQNHKNIIKTLLNQKNGLKLTVDLKKCYIQLLEYSKRIWELLENQKEMVEVLNSTNESLLNYRISDIMKTLTIFSVITFPLTLFAAIFGMNIDGGMPLQHHPLGFWIIITFMLLGCVGMVLYFKKRNWL